MIRALILDLDNTVFPTHTISPTLFKELFQVMDKYRDEVGAAKMEEAKIALSRKAFQSLSETYKFSQELQDEAVPVLRESTYPYPIKAFSDYGYIKKMSVDKYLVTMGYEAMQQSKIDMLDVKADFKETHVNDPEKTDQTKKEIFEDIIKRNGYQPDEVLIIGDDLDSEIKAAKDLGLAAVLYDPHGDFPEGSADRTINNYKELPAIIDEMNKQ